MATRSRRSNYKRKSTRKKSKRGLAARQASSVITTIRSGLTLDRKFDIAGVLLALSGVLTFFALFSSGGGLAAIWVVTLATWFGRGVYLLPIALIVVGLWLVVRNAERVPSLSVERLVGFVLLFTNILTWLHFFTFPDTSDVENLNSIAGGGGGYLGGVLFIFLVNGLGVWGAGVALLGWFVIATALTFDVSVLTLFQWIPPLVLRVQDYWDDRRAASQGAQVSMLFEHAEASIKTPEVVPDEPHPVPTEPFESGLPREDAIQEAAMIKEPEKIVWKLPEIADMLDVGTKLTVNQDFDQSRGRVIEETLASFGAPAQVVEINRGPTITQFGVEPAFIEGRNGRTRVRVSKISALSDDLALALAASRIRIQAPVPGKGFVGIEVPNEEIASVALRGVIESDAFKKMRSPLKFALGQDVAGNAVTADLASMPHLLIAGSTGSGKSVCVNALINCLLLNNTPETVRFIMIDPKRVELTGYNGIPHLMAPVVTELERVVGVLQWVTREMDGRYQKFAEVGARNITDYNLRLKKEGRVAMHYLVVIIDELADLMMVAPDQTERLITRMAQLARATGIHLVISTQRPSVDVVTGLIKANIPSRISFAVASGTDSRVILDQPGAEKLLGQGDMLFQAPDAPAPVRLQGVYVSEPEIFRLVQHWRAFGGTTKTAPIATSTRPIDAPPTGVPLKQLGFEEMEEQEPKDKLYDEALDLIRRQGRASISMLQRRLRIGYTRSARMIELMEEEGMIGPAKKGAQTREVLDYGQAAPPVGER